MYEEEDEDMPRHLRAFTNHLQTGSSDFNTRLANYVITHFGGIEAAAEGLKKADTEKTDLESRGMNTDHLTLNNFLPAHLLTPNMMGLQHQMARQQQQLFGHPMPQQFMQQNMASNMLHMQQPQMSYPHSPYGMRTPQQQQQMQIQQQMQQQFNQQQQFNNNNNMNQQMQQQQHVQPLQLTNGNLQIPAGARVRSASARSIHSNSPLAPATSPGGMLTAAQINERRSNSVRTATPIPSIEDEATQNSMVLTNSGPQRTSISNSSSSSNRPNEYLQQDNSLNDLLGMPNYDYGVSADIFATATPGPQQGGNGYFQPHHFASQHDPMAEMFKIGSAATPFDNEAHNSFQTGGNVTYTVKREQGQNGLTGQQLTIQPKQINTSNQAVNQYLQSMEDSKAGLLSERGGELHDDWEDWTAGGDYNNEQEA